MKHKKIDIWKKIFLLCDHKKNAFELKEYFFEQCVVHPRQAHKFLLGVYELIHDEKDKQMQKVYADKYMSALSDIFQQFGLYEKKCLLDDLYFQIFYPTEYKHVTKQINSHIKKRSASLEKVKRRLKKICTDNGLKCHVSYRIKNPFSAFRKMKNQMIENVTSIHDLVGFRMIVQSENDEDCYKVLNAIHNNYSPDIRSFKDYIKIPKTNGYQSIHTGVFGLDDDPSHAVEIQIRSNQMDLHAKTGAASHLLYKLDTGIHTILNATALKLRKLDNTGMIYVLTKDMHLMKVKKGSTCVDFADKIHSRLAARLIGVFINGESESLDYVLKEGDIVHLVAHPLRRRIRPSWKKTNETQPTLKNKHAQTR